MKKDMILHTRNEEQCALGRTRVRLKAYCSAPWGVLRTLLLLLLLMVGVGEMWGQDYSGVYYIASDYQTPNTTTRNYSTTLTDNFYLCPTENWISYSSTSPNWTTGDDKPFLTTYKARLHANDPAPDTYDLTQAKWTIEFYANVNGTDYYYFKHSSGQYMVLNNSISAVTGNNNKAMRLRVHLETLTSQQLEDEDTRNMALFSITQDSRSIVIKPKTQSSYQLTVNNGNSDYLRGEGTGKGYIQDGSIKYGTEGTIAIFNNANDDNKYFYLEDYITRPLITYNSNNLIEITDQTGSATAIYYTTDGTTPTTSSTLYEGPFDPAEGVTTIKAIVVVGGEASNVAVYTTPVLCGNTHSYLIQSQNNAWNTDKFHFYMIPGDVDNNVQKVNTTSLFRPSMEWHFESAGVEDGVQFYYIVNNSAKDNENNPYYLCWDGTNVCMLIYDSNNANKFKFKIVESPVSGTFNIIPYDLRNASGNTNRFVYKPDDGNNKCNANAKALSLSSTSNAHSQWKFVQPITLDKIAPFTVSDASTTFYYKINSVGSSGYYIVPPSGNNTNATTSNSTDANVVKTGAWYFEEAQAATDDDWLTYYHIRNAETGKYLYFDKDANNAGACLLIKETIESGNEDRYMFTWAKTAATEANYYIIPKLLKDKSQNNFSSLQRDNGTLKTNLTRGASNYAWTFTLFCNDPVFEEEEGVIKIKCHTNAANIYINTESDADPTGGSTLYNPTQVTAQNWATTDQVRIKAIAIVSDGTTIASSSVVTLLNKPDVTLEAGPYTYKAAAWEPGVTVSIGEGENATTAASDTYTTKYENNTDAGTANVTIEDADATDAWYIWNVPVKEFTIDKKDLTITANPKTIGYGDEPDNDGVTYGEFAGSETETVLGGTLGYSYTTKGDNPQPYTPYDPSYGNIGEYDITPHGLISQNYVITFVSGTMTVTQKSIGTGSLAEGFTLNFDEDNDVILNFGTHTLTKNEDYTIGDEVSGEKYSSKTISGTGNYTGSVAIRNAKVHFTTDEDQEEWSATFVAESSGETDIGHALPNDITAYIISGIEGDWAIPEALDYIPAGVPVLLVTHEEKNGFLVTDANSGSVAIISDPQKGYNKLKEVTGTAASFATREIYVLYNNEFVLNMAGDLSVGKVYMENPNYDSASPAPARLRIKWGEDTGIKDLENNGTTEKKNDIWYTIDGQRLSGQPSTRGLYINGGKKIMVK